MVVIGDQWSDSDYVLKMVPAGFADGWDVGCEEEESKVTAALLA